MDDLWLRQDSAALFLCKYVKSFAYTETIDDLTYEIATKSGRKLDLWAGTYSRQPRRSIAINHLKT